MTHMVHAEHAMLADAAVVGAGRLECLRMTEGIKHGKVMNGDYQEGKGATE